MDRTVLGRGDAPRAARRTVAAYCADGDAGQVCADSSELMTSEVVTNAVLHSSGAVTLGVVCGERYVRVEVADDNRTRPAVRPAGDDWLGGRGMMIVDALASSWGVTDIAAGGKTVWFEVPLQP